VSHRSKKGCSTRPASVVEVARGVSICPQGKSSTPSSPRADCGGCPQTSKIQNKDMASKSSIRKPSHQFPNVHTAIEVIPMCSSESLRLRPRVHQKSSNTAVGGNLGNRMLGSRKWFCTKDRYLRVFSSSNFSFSHIDLKSA
jgi:hypothetical protein